MVNQHPPQQMFPAASAPDTKIGGAAGMAGVGRRGFAAAAAAAMFTVAHPQPHRNFVDMKPPILNIPDPGMLLSNCMRMPSVELRTRYNSVASFRPTSSLSVWPQLESRSWIKSRTQLRSWTSTTSSFPYW
jgi:hypothetical protein